MGDWPDAALLSKKDENERWKAFDHDRLARPHSVVGPMGTCIVYAGWKMADQAQAPCDDAERRLPGNALVDVARADLAQRRGLLDEVDQALARALATDATCVPAHVLRGRVKRAQGDDDAALAAFQAAQGLKADCFECAVQSAELLEKKQDRAGAVVRWERALALVPDHAEALKRYAAALVGGTPSPADQQRALAAYEKAIDLGMTDPSTLLAAARLAAPVDLDRAVDYATRAAAKREDDVDAWRLVVELQRKKGDGAAVLTAADEVLRLLPDDGAAHLIMARTAASNERWVDAVVHYDALAKTAAQGPVPGLDPAELAAAKAEQKKLATELQIGERGASGQADAVVGEVLKTAKKVFADRKKRRPALAGKVQFVIKTDEAGDVRDVVVKDDTLGDTRIAASIVGNLRRAKIKGGQKSYAFTMEFQ